MKPIIATIILAFAALTSVAQIASTKLPISTRNGIAHAHKTVSIAPPPLSKSAAIETKGRLYFGKLLPCDIHFMEESTATTTDGGSIYTLQLTSQGAYSIGLRTEGLVIADGCELYIYDNDQEDILGAIKSNESDMSILTRQIQGDTINIELFVPQGVKQNDFKITAICYDYANMFGKYSKGFGSRAACSTEININCDEGQAFQDIKHAVVLLTIDTDTETFVCTGTIVNNTKCDQTPFILTAAHCICTEEAANNTVIYFNYENKSCSTTSGVTNYNSMTGATIAATAPKKKYTDRSGRSSSKEYPTMDFTLLRLKKSIPEDYQPYYAGLSISETDNLSSVAVIHHPQGDTKKISISRNQPYQDSYPAEDNNVHYNNFCHWHISRWNVGTTEGGSSGCAMLNTKKQVIGILSGGYADCKNPVNDFFQMISKAWNSSSNPTNQLKSPLASGSNVKEIMPYNPFNIGEKYLPATVSAQISSDSTYVQLSWETIIKQDLALFSEDFEQMTSNNDIDNVFLANVDMDNDRSAWKIATETISPDITNTFITSRTSSRTTTNDYLTLPQLTIRSGTVIKFRAKSEGGTSTLTISQNTRPSRYKQITSLEIDTEWNEYQIPLDEYAGSSIYINISHTTPNGNSTALCIDDITIESSKNDEDAPKISGYEIYNGDHLLQTISDTATRSYIHHVQDGNTYTYYVLNTYDDGATSNFGNSVVIDLSDPTTATSEHKQPQKTLKAYPNPSTGSIYITASHNIEHSDLIITDITGRKVMTQKISGIAKGETFEIQIDALRPGMYTIIIDRETAKIQKQ